MSRSPNGFLLESVCGFSAPFSQSALRIIHTHGQFDWGHGLVISLPVQIGTDCLRNLQHEMPIELLSILGPSTERLKNKVRFVLLPNYNPVTPERRRGIRADASAINGAYRLLSSAMRSSDDSACSVHSLILSCPCVSP